MEDNNKNVIKTSKSRIVYTEPNFVNSTSSTGAEFSVPLEDLCISVNLLAEVSNRFTYGVKGGENETYLMSWGSNDKNEVSFLSGVKLDRNSDDRYLTTYFTDITYEDVKGGKVIEGLGIESIDINFESWYTPTVVIKFIDVRGSSMLTPNEYGQEVNNETYVTSEKLYKCFFTFPYPKFKLCVKGFYGKPVTFQLTCSKFTGSFNSTNGNFEATATFIGYNYSLLTDIQFQYLVAAPYDTYFGAQYFNEKKTQEDWLLSNGEIMPTLTELMNSIAAATGKIEERMSTDPSISKRSSISNEIDSLNNLLIAYSNMVDGFKVDNNIIVNNDNQIIFGYSSSEKKTYNYDNYIKYHETFNSLLNDYNSQYNGQQIPVDKIPKNLISTIDKSSQYQPVKLFTITKKDNITTNIFINSKIGETIDTVLKNKKLNDGLKIDEGLIDKIKTLVSNKSILVQEYVYIYNISDFHHLILAKIDDCNYRLSNTEKDVDIFVKDSIIETIGFVPTVGNISKIICAHLETFLHSIFNCVTNIKNQVNDNQRTFASYGIKIEDTDLSVLGEKGKSIPPFPLYLDRGSKTKYCGDEDSNMDVTGWLGDVRGDAEEVKLIYGYIKAVQTIVDRDDFIRNEINNATKPMTFLPASPVDLSNNRSPFSYSNMGDNVLDDFIGHVGLRMTLLFGYLFNLKNGNYDKTKMSLIAEQLGKMDGLNYYGRNITRDEINDKILKVIGDNGEKTANDIINSLTCIDDNFSQYHPASKTSNYAFELIKGGTHYYRERNAMVCKTDSKSLLYSYIFVNEEDSNDTYKDLFLLPTTPKSFKDYKSDYLKDGNPFSMPIFSNDTNTAYITLTDSNIKVNYSGEVDMNKYLNPSVCNIYSYSESGNIMELYKQLKSGDVHIKDYQTNIKLEEFLETVWNVEDKILTDYYNVSPYYKSSDLSKYFGFDKLDANSVSSLNGRTSSWYFLYSKLTSEKLLRILPSHISEAIKISSTEVWNFEGWFTGNDLTTDEIILNTINSQPKSIDYFTIPMVTICDDKTEYSLFGHPFYYMQNDNLNGENTNKKVERITKSKALLLLHSLPLLYNSFKFWNDKNGKINRIPKAVSLFIGGILWRERFATENNLEDVFIYDNKHMKYKKPVNGKKSILYNSIQPHGRIDVKNMGINFLTFFGYDIFSLRESVKNAFIQNFETWAMSSDGFGLIRSNCELTNSNGSPMTTKQLVECSTVWGKNFRNGTYETLLKFPTQIEQFLKTLGGKFLSTYSSFSSVNSNGFKLLFREETNVQNEMKDLFSEYNIVSFGTYALSGKDREYTNEIFYSEDIAKTYINSILTTLNRIVKDENSVKNKDKDSENSLTKNRDINIAMYSYFKNIYDKWLSSTDEGMFDVKNFFNENFIFVDTFYRNIRNKMVLNCDYLLRRYLETVDSTTLFSYLADVYSHHGMIFTPMSHFLNWAEEDVLQDMFKPIPFNSAPPIAEHNKFICMYVHEPSKNLNIGGSNSSYGYKYDGFDIWTPDSGTSIQPRVFFQKGIEANISNDTRYAYNIPAFGVAFGKANQSYFKSISVNMDNPITTEYSIKAIWDIANLAKNDNTKVHFIGQDLFSVWSNYSYTCEVEMLGCAQIQPLMYFQLLNIPMFRGTYIITNVSHSLSPGNMTTKFIGRKLSKNGQPFNTQPFGMLGILSKNGSGYFGGGYGNNTLPYDSYYGDKSYVFNDPETIVVPSDDCGCEGEQNGWEGLKPIMKKLFYALKGTIEHLDGNEGGKKWTICLSSGFRENSKKNSRGKYSDHKFGYAIDLQIKRNNQVISGNQPKPELGIVFDIICTTYYNYINQLIMEYHSDEGLSASWSKMVQNPNMYHTIHFSSYGKMGEQVSVDGNMEINERTIWQAYSKNGTNVSLKANEKSKNFSQELNIIKNKKTDTTLIRSSSDYDKLKRLADDSLDFISPVYKEASRKKYYLFTPNNVELFKRIFTSYSKVSSELLGYYFGESGLFGVGYLSRKKGKGYSDQIRCKNVSAFIEKINTISQTYGFNPNWLMIVMAGESGFDPSAVADGSKATGLIQIMPSYYVGKWHMTTEQLRVMDATDQLTYVDKYFKEVHTSFPKTKYTHPSDLYLVTLAPAILSVNNRNESSVIYSSDSIKHPSVISEIASNSSAQYEGNKRIDVTNNGYITIKDVENWFVKKALEFKGTDDDMEKLNYMLASSTYT